MVAPSISQLVDPYSVSSVSPAIGLAKGLVGKVVEYRAGRKMGNSFIVAKAHVMSVILFREVGQHDVEGRRGEHLEKGELRYRSVDARWDANAR